MASIMFISLLMIDVLHSNCDNRPQATIYILSPIGANNAGQELKSLIQFD
jgi:hypothetical protein